MGRLLASTVFALVITTMAAAPLAGQQSWWISPAATFPTGDFGDDADTGWNVATGLNFAVGEGGFWVGPAVSYGSNNASEGDDSASQLSFIANAGISTNEPGERGLFFFGNTGYSSFNIDSDTSDPDTDWGPFIGGGAGVSIPAGESNNFFFGGRYFHGLSDIDNVNYFAVFVGLGFAVGGDGM